MVINIQDVIFASKDGFAADEGAYIHFVALNR